MSMVYYVSVILSPISGINRITQVFGVRPEDYSQFSLKGHNGVDLTPRFKTKMATIYSPLEGVVTVVKDEGNEGYGKYVKLRSTAPDDKGRIKEVVLAHLSSIKVYEGQFVYLLDEIGIEGNTGFSTAPHLHFGLRYINHRTNIIENYDNGFKGYVDFLNYMRFWALPSERLAYGIIVNY